MSDNKEQNFNTCQICGIPNPPDNHYWKEHKIAQKDYFIKYFPKKDLLTGEKLPFKNRESYYLANFINKANFREYLESNNSEIALEYLIEWLIKRRKIKNLVYAPSCFEIRSFLFPAINYIEIKYGKGTYNQICAAAGLINRYDYNQELSFDREKVLNFIIDSREQTGLLNLPNIQVKKLEYGDYCIENNTNSIFIERKSLIDLISSVTSGYDRFSRELERAKQDNSYLIIVVEDKFSNLLEFPKYFTKTKVTPDYLQHNIRELLNSFPLNVQIVCAGDRQNAAKIIETIFRIKNDIRTVDLQFFKDKSII